MRHCARFIAEAQLQVPPNVAININTVHNIINNYSLLRAITLLRCAALQVANRMAYLFPLLTNSLKDKKKLTNLKTSVSLLGLSRFTPLRKKMKAFKDRDFLEDPIADAKTLQWILNK